MVTTAPCSLFGRVWRDQLRRCHNCWGGTQSTRRPHVCVAFGIIILLPSVNKHDCSVSSEGENNNDAG